MTPPVFGQPTTAAQWVRALRARRRLSQRELAELADLPASTVSRIEAGTSDPRFATMRTVVRATGHEFAVRDSRGLLVLSTPERDERRDRGERRYPAHLRLFRTPSITSAHYRDWWGWERVAFWDGEPAVPEWTYWRRTDRRSGLLPVPGMELGRLWDDAT